MCATCGCGPGQVSIEGGKAPQGVAHGHDHHGDDHARHHAHGHSHSHSHAHDHAPAATPEAGVSARTLVLERDILAENNRFAAENRRVFARTGTLALNLMSSPGAGKTSLLVETLKALGPVPAVVIEGDQQTTNDAERIRATGRQAVQINTGKGCHLDAHMVGHALERLTLEKRGLVFIENVGNLVCPAAFDLGEAKRVVLFSVTEGEDKPLKYPDMFAIADVVVITKTDLAPHVEADVAAMKAHVARINPAAIVLETSIRGAGLAPWRDWLIAERRAMAEAERARLAGELAALEADLSADRPATPVVGA